jgi:hypothetical protein
MSTQDAQRELKDERAVVISIDQKEFSDIIMVRRKWENVPVEDSQEYIEYLNSLDRTVIDPSGCPTGTYRVLRNVYVNDEGERDIHQFLAKNLNTGADFGDPSTPPLDEDTGWRLYKGSAYRASNNQVVLELPYTDPEFAEAIIADLDEATYTNEIYTLNGGLLEGTWHNIRAAYDIDPSEGWATVRWFLSKQANDDLHFAYQKNDGTFSVDFFKFDAADTGINSFETDYYFDALGDWYISDDNGVNYVQKNGEAATGVMPTSTGIGNIRTKIPGRVSTVEVNRNPENRFYRLHTHIDYLTDRSYGLAFYSDEFVLVTDIAQYTDIADIQALSNDYYVNQNTGTAVYSPNASQTAPYYNLLKSLPGRTVDIKVEFDEQQGKYRTSATVIHYLSGEIFTTYVRNENTRVSDLMVFGMDRETLNAETQYYYFNASGDWYYSSNGTTSITKNGVPSVLNLIAENAYNISGSDPTPRNVSPPRIERNPNAPVYILNLHVEYTSEVTGGNVTTYGTPNISVTDTVMFGGAALPVSAGTSDYNDAGTIETETAVLSPRFDSERGTWSYVQRVITKQAPHMEVSEAPGYVEGPSEIKIVSEPLALAKGVGSGFASVGSWAGGGQGRVRYVSTGDGTGDLNAANGDTVQVTKKFQPYNITLARCHTVRTSARLYYYVKEPTYGQYPDVLTWAPNAQAITQIGYSIEQPQSAWARITMSGTLAGYTVGTFVTITGANSYNGLHEIMYVEEGINAIYIDQAYGASGETGNIVIASAPKQSPINGRQPSEVSDTISETVISTNIDDDTSALYGPSFIGDGTSSTPGYWQDDSNWYGKITRRLYSDEEFTLAYNEAHVEIGSSVGANDWENNINWRELTFIRHYPAVGTFAITAVANSGDNIVLSVVGHGLTTSDALLIRGTTDYDGYYEIVAVAANTVTVYFPNFVSTQTGTIVRIDATALKAGTVADSATDDGLYMGHKVQDNQSFYTEAIRHRILKVAPSVYALVVETSERTPWKTDDTNKWILNAEGLDIQYGGPPSVPSPADVDGTSDVPILL